jgi:protein-L-isoaspartate(D-aspartate) O-methyltransferase
MTTVRDQDSIQERRATMIRELLSMDAIASDRVEEAFAVVPRHLFAPDEPLEAAYDPDNAVTVKRDPSGRVLSCMSAAFVQAAMLEQAQVEPGMRVLEIGSGGYQAALLAELVGTDGEVTTVDIDTDVTRRARQCLDAAGYQRVRVVTADAEHGVPEYAPYDRIIVTVRAWDIPPAWLGQLTEAGRLVVPLHLAAVTRSIAFDRTGDTLTSRTYRLAHFVPMQGAGAHPDHLTSLGEGVALRTDSPLTGIDPAAVGAALHGPHTDYWSGTAFDMPDELDLFLLTSEAGMAMLHASEEAISHGLVGVGARLGVPALVRGGNIAWNIKRDSADPATGGFESGAAACGPDAEAVGADYARLLRRWATNYRYRNAATIRYLPAGTSTPAPEGWHVVKRHGTLVVSWPQAPDPATDRVI